MLKFKKKNSGSQAPGRNLIAAINPKSPISEQYRTIRTNIQFSMVDKELKTLACTSATMSEGKSTTITNLAVTIARQGQKVLLVDADLRKPTIHKIMEVKNQHGLTNLLTKKKNSKEAILPAPKVKNLYILPSGPIPPNPAELLGSKAMEDLILKLSEKYDFILFDTPPVLAVTDAQVLGSFCDGVVLVLKSHTVDRKDLIKTKELLDKTNINLIGAIFNGVEPKEVDDYYYYGID